MKAFHRKNNSLLLSVLYILIITVLSLSYTVSAGALLKVGEKPVAFSLKDIKGKDVSLSQFSDKKAVIILFWSTWSLKSPLALERFQGYYSKYKDKGIQVIGINVEEQTISEEELAHIKQFVQDLGITFPVLIDRDLRTFRSYDVIAVPSTIVITEGKISYEMPALPLVGTEDMFDYLLVLAGEEPRKIVEPGYMPKHGAIANTNLARQFVKKNMNIMAYPLFKKAIEKDPKYMLPYVEMAKLYGSEGKYMEAEETLRQALSVEPDNVVVMSELGYLLTKAGKIEEALDTLGKAVKTDTYAPSIYYYAYALSKAGRLEDSLKSFDTAISLNPFEPEIFLLRAGVYEESGMLKESANDYKRALELFLNVQTSSSN